MASETPLQHVATLQEMLKKLAEHAIPAKESDAIQRLADAAAICIEDCAQAEPPFKVDKITKVLAAVHQASKRSNLEKYHKICAELGIDPKN